jgi:tRNA nucleotidyltransferase/poly(A) polymerase
MSDKVEINKEVLEKLIEIILDGDDLLEKIPKMQDEGRHSEISQEIGAELEARIHRIDGLEQEEPIIGKIISEQIESLGGNPFEELEKQVLS